MKAAVMMLLAAMSTADLERADAILGEVLDEVMLVKAEPEDARLEKFRALYVKALGKVLRSKFDAFEEAAPVGDLADDFRAVGPGEQAEGRVAEQPRALKGKHQVPEILHREGRVFDLGQPARIRPLGRPSHQGTIEAGVVGLAAPCLGADGIQ